MIARDDRPAPRQSLGFSHMAWPLSFCTLKGQRPPAGGTQGVPFLAGTGQAHRTDPQLPRGREMSLGLCKQGAQGSTPHSWGPSEKAAPLLGDSGTQPALPHGLGLRAPKQGLQGRQDEGAHMCESSYWEPKHRETLQQTPQHMQAHTHTRAHTPLSLIHI